MLGVGKPPNVKACVMVWRTLAVPEGFEIPVEDGADAFLTKIVTLKFCEERFPAMSLT
jgi:hypothetical protein